MNYQDFKEAVDDAEQTMNRADRMAKTSARLLIGRLRRVSDGWQGEDTLIALKKELSQYNATKREWKS